MTWTIERVAAEKEQPGGDFDLIVISLPDEKIRSRPGSNVCPAISTVSSRR